MLLIGLFAGLAVALSLVGLYAVVSYSVAERLQEMSLRLALGAQPSNLLTMVLTEGLRLVVVGIALGLCAALGLTRLLEQQLFGVHPRDFSTFVTVPVALLLASMVGCLVPARRAMRVDPASALRGE
jgi:ABC-type antimicrobial peptide transport system permease subunit